MNKHLCLIPSFFPFLRQSDGDGGAMKIGSPGCHQLRPYSSHLELPKKEHHNLQSLLSIFKKTLLQDKKCTCAINNIFHVYFYEAKESAGFYGVQKSLHTRKKSTDMCSLSGSQTERRKGISHQQLEII
jgi:hypothetical protein